MRSEISPSRTILRIFRCVPANLRLWRLEICVLCMPHDHYNAAAGYVGCHTLDSWRSRQALPLLGLLQRAQKFAVPCKNTASKEQSPLNFSWAVHSVS